MDARYDILELSRFLTELSVIDYFFVGQRQSTVALAALLNSMEAIPGVSESAIDDLTRELTRLPTLDPSEHDVLESRQRLRVLYEQGGYERPETLSDTETRNDAISPVCVSHGVTLQGRRYESNVSNSSRDVKENCTFFDDGADFARGSISRRED